MILNNYFSKQYLILLFAFGLLISCGDTEPSADAAATTVASNNNNTSTAPPNKVATIQGTPTTIQGDVVGLKTGQKIFFDKKTPDAFDVFGQAVLDSLGHFEIQTGISEAGVYRVRLGARPVYMLLKGGETVDVKATMDGFKIEDYTLTGGLHAEEVKEWTADLDHAKITAYLSETTEVKPLLDLFLVEKLDLVSNIKLYQKVSEKLNTAFPNASYTRQFNSKVMSMVAKLKSMPVTVGAEAPEINLPDPDGKKRALSSLRGKVVLLDFWASWCRPCRVTNPHVVELYKKYKKKGFDIFNVSLDGVSDQMAVQRYQNNAETIAQAMEIEKGKWRQAIKQDKLTWKNHVSELRSWSSPVAALYGVNSIPKTFVLDRNGVIRYQDLRGQDLENAIKTLLAEK